MPQQAQQLSEDELVKKYSSPEPAAPASNATGLSEEDLLKKYGGPQPHATTANNSVENANTVPKDYGFTAGNAWKNLKELGSGAVEMGKDIIAPPGNTEGERLSYLGKKYITGPADVEAHKAQTAQTPWESIGHSVAEAIPVIGPFAASLGEQAGKGDVGGAVTKGAGALLGGKALEKVGDAATEATAGALPTAGRMAGRVAGGEPPLQVVRTTVGDYIHDPTTGDLKPIPKNVAKVGGGVVGAKLGYSTGLPEAGLGGLYLGKEAGPTLLEKAFPESAGRVAGRATTEAPQVVAAPAVEPKLGTPNAEQLELPTHSGPLFNQEFEAPEPKLTPKLEVPSAPAATEEPKLTPKAPSLESLLNESLGVTKPAPGEPLKAGKTVPANEPAPTETDPLKVKYPDSAVRQMVRANGEGIVNAIGDDKATMKAVHDLKNTDIGVAAAKLGFDIGQRIVSSAAQYGPDAVPRSVVLDELVKAGHSPQEILDAAKPAKK